MSENIYAVIHSGEGDVTVKFLVESELLKHLNENYWGQDRVFTSKDLVGGLNLTERSGLLILRGEVVIPTPEKIVERWKL